MAPAEEKYKTIFELSPEAIGVLDTEGNILTMNGRVYDWLGYRPKEIIGKNILDVPYLTDEGKITVMEKFQQRMLGKKVPPYELDFIAKNGKKMVGRVLATPITNERGKITQSIIMISDITDLKNMETMLRESESRYRTLFKTLPIGAGLATPEGKVLSCNRAMCQIIGYPEQELKQLNLKNTYQNPQDRQRLLGRLKTAGFVRNFEAKLKRKNGAIYDANLTIVPFRQGNRNVFLTVCEDITHRKEVEQMKSDLVSLVSHQLKTPIAEIKGYIENMLMGVTGEFTDKQKQYLQEMYEISLKNQRLISNLLNVSKIERGVITIEIQTIKLNEIVDTVMQNYQEKISQKGLILKIETDKEISVRADKDKLIEALSNIMDNAVKFTDRGKITVKIKIIDNYGVVEVADTGRGISKEILKTLFQKEKILAGFPASGTGTGLGLYIAKNFLKLQKGEILVNSIPNKGSVFTLKIPRKTNKKHALRTGAQTSVCGSAD